MAEEPATPTGDIHHVAYTRMVDGKIQQISPKGFNPKEDKIMRAHVGKEDSSKMESVSHVSQEFEDHVVSDARTGQPFSVGPPQEQYEEHDMVMVSGFDEDAVMSSYFKGKLAGDFDKVITGDIKELQDAGDLSRSNSDEISGYVKDHYSEHIGTVGFVWEILPASENTVGEDLYGVISMANMDADGDPNQEDQGGERVNRAHVHFYKASDLVPANTDEQGEHKVPPVKGTPKPDHKYIRRELSNGDYNYIYEEPSGKQGSYDQEGYLEWIKEQRDEAVGGSSEAMELFSSWRDPETGRLNNESLRDLSDEDLVAYGGKISHNTSQGEWEDHLQNQKSLSDAEQVKGSLANSESQMGHFNDLMESTDPDILASYEEKEPIELAAIHMDASGMLLRDKKGNIHPDKFILDRIHDGFLPASDETKKMAEVLTDYIEKSGEADLNLENLGDYADAFLENENFNDNTSLASFQALSMLASGNDNSVDAPWDRGETQQALATGRSLLERGALDEYKSLQGRFEERQQKEDDLLAQQENVDFQLPSTINTEVEWTPGKKESFAPFFYQNQYANWMDSVGSGINGASTGLGKTIQTIMATEKAIAEDGHEGAIIFAPIPVQEGWTEEIERFVEGGAANHAVLSREDASSKLASPEMANTKYIILPYSFLQGDMNDPAHRNRLAAFEKRAANRKIYSDEGLGLSNEDTQTYRSLSDIIPKTKGMMILNATPMSGDPRKLHAQMNLLQPGLLPEWDVFKETHTVPLLDDTGKEIDRVWDSERVDALFNNTLKPYIYMRYEWEPEIAKVLNLPEKEEVPFNVTMTGFQKTLYDAVEAESLAELINKPLDDKTSSILNRKEMLLRQVAFHPRMILEHTSDPEVIAQIENATSAKWEASLNRMRIHFSSEESKVASGEIEKVRGVLVPVAQVRVLDYMKGYYAESLGIAPEEIGIIRGGMSDDERSSTRQGFNDGRIKVLLLSQQAAGYGLNLQRNTNMLEELDDAWGPDMRKQYIARGWRTGNKSKTFTVNTYRDSSAHSDKSGERRIQNKSEIVNMFVGDPSSTPTVSDNDDVYDKLLGIIGKHDITLEQFNELRGKSGLGPLERPEPAELSGLSNITAADTSGKKKTPKALSAPQKKAKKIDKPVPPENPSSTREDFTDMARGMIND